MYIYARIRKYVTGGADLSPPALNRLNRQSVAKNLMERGVYHTVDQPNELHWLMAMSL